MVEDPMKILLLYGADYQLSWGRSQNMARALAKQGHEVTYINHIKPASVRNVLNFLHKPVLVEENLLLYPDIPGLPQGKLPWLAIFNALLQPLYLWRVLKYVQKFDLLITYSVPLVPIFLQKALFGLFEKRVHVYDCADDKVSSARDLFSHKIALLVEKKEKNLLKFVDAVTAINTHNIERLELPLTMPNKAIGNGVDLDLFKQLSPAPKMDSPLKKVVYIGAINDRLDVEKIVKLLQHNHRRLEIHFYGNRHPVLKRLQKEKNFFYHGYAPYEELPSILSEYHYGLLPYRDIQSIRMSFPLKTLQYLACGLPVLAFSYKGINTFEGRVSLIEKELPESIDSSWIEGRRFLQGYTWDAMAKQFADFYQKLK